MSDPPEDVPSDLFDRMQAAGHGMFTLAVEGDLTERETALVNAAVDAGVLGALAVFREDHDPDER